MPSDRPSPAAYAAVNTYSTMGWGVFREGRAVTYGLDQVSAVRLAECLNNEMAAATARSDCEQCEFLRESNKAYRQSRQESWDIAEKWQAIARGLYEATSDIVDQIRDSPGTISLTGIDVRLWASLTQYEKALRDLESASLGEGEGGR